MRFCGDSVMGIPLCKKYAKTIGYVNKYCGSIYYTSGSILYIRIYTIHPDLCCIFRCLAMHVWQCKSHYHMTVM